MVENFDLRQSLGISVGTKESHPDLQNDNYFDFSFIRNLRKMHQGKRQHCQKQIDGDHGVHEKEIEFGG